MIILYFLDLPVEMLKNVLYSHEYCLNVEILIFLPVNSEEGESRKRSVNIVLHFVIYIYRPTLF